jgi:hypothetical protein
MLGWLVNKQDIEPRVPVFDKSQRTDGIFARDDVTEREPPRAVWFDGTERFGRIWRPIPRRFPPSDICRSAEEKPFGSNSPLGVFAYNHQLLLVRIDHHGFC